LLTSIFHPARILSLLATASIVFMTGGSGHSGTTADPFTNLRGNWKGSGTMTLKDGKKHRLACYSQYSGTATQLRLVIDCKSDINTIIMKAQLSANQGNLLGTWREETFRAIGTISGRVSDGNRIKFRIGGNVLGTMSVRYTKRSQNVSIKAAGFSLEDVTIKMKRR